MLKKILKKIFRRPVLFIANSIEKVLYMLQDKIDNATIEKKQRFSKVVCYLFMFGLISIYFLPVIIAIITLFIKKI